MGIYLIIIGLLPIVLGVLVLTVANVIPSEVTLAWGTVIAGGIYVLMGIINMQTRIFEKILSITSFPFWVYIIVLLPILALCYMQASPLYR